MWARATRLEFIIVSVALLVLLLCSKPPKSGNADVSDFSDPISAQERSAEETTSAPGEEDFGRERAQGEAMPAESTDLAEQLRDPLASVADPPREQNKRVATVDARSCNRLGYGDVMYGEVTVRWVWNGTKFVPHKVCVVKEKNGVSSVWSFDRQDEASLSEVSAGKD